jgi:predicted transcriptional regulator YdeE
MKKINFITVIVLLLTLLSIFCGKAPEESNKNTKAVAVKNMENLDIKIVNKDDIQAVGITLSTSFKEGQSKKDIPPFFHKTLHEGTLNNVPNKLNQNLMCVFLVKPDSPDFTYAIAKEVSSLENLQDGMTPLSLPAADYASVEIIKNGHDDVAPVFKYLLPSHI